MAGPSKLGIVAGSGELPRRLIAACQAQGRPFFVLALKDNCDPQTVEGVPHAWIRPGQGGSGLAIMRANGATELVLAGGVKRPSALALWPDWRTFKFFAALGWRGIGDDSLLRAILKALEEEGFHVTGAADLLHDYLAPEGALGRIKPDDAARADIALGFAAARMLGTRDIGQAAVARNGQVIGREGPDGTDALLHRVAASGGAGGVLVKAAKPGQERRADLPTIGPDTVATAAAAGLKGIAVEAHATLLIDRAALVAAADRAGLFVTGIKPEPAAVPAGAPLVYLVAGEPSGDALGANLMRALKYRAQGAIRFAGIGGERMTAEGLQSLFPMDDLSVMGVAEVLPRARRILKRVKQTASDIRVRQPAAVVTIDSSGFNWRVAQKLRGAGETLPLIHYVAPMVWAWRGGRSRRMARWYDHLMALLPFEPPFFTRVGLSCAYVGHPVVEMGADKGDGAGFRARHGIGRGDKVLAVLPGSRGGEVGRLLAVFAAAVQILAARYPNLAVVLPVTENVAAQVSAAAATWPGVRVFVLRGPEKYDGIAAADAAIAASGTVTLELAMARVPHLVAYRLFGPTHALLKRVLKVDYANLVNIILGRRAIPELIQHDCTPEKVAAEAIRLLDDRGAREAQLFACQEALKTLGYGELSPGLRAADEVLARLRR